MGLQFRRWTLFLGLLGMFAGMFGRGLFAQDTSSMYGTAIRTYNIRKIFSHRLGYRIDVMDYQGNIRTIYAKVSWFADPAQRNSDADTFEVKASMNYTPVASLVPSNYLTLQYESGNLVSMTIYVDRPNAGPHSIWYSVDPREDIDSKFDVRTVVFTPLPPPPTVPQNTPKTTAEN
ncbi:MAG: hypothetical protein AAF975_06070 [Spirochaetota bacterium]